MIIIVPYDSLQQPDGPFHLQLKKSNLIWKTNLSVKLVAIVIRKYFMFASERAPIKQPLEQCLHPKMVGSSEIRQMALRVVVTKSPNSKLVLKKNIFV
jgi:hypothetical protein